MPNLVSIIIPTFNRKDYVLDALRSALGQTYRPIEIIVIDDGSTDGTKQAVHDWWHDTSATNNNDAELRIIRQANGGAAQARNTGLLNSSGKYIQFLDSDDILHHEKLDVQLTALNNNPDIGFVFSSYCTFSDDQKKINQNTLCDQRSATIEGHLCQWPIGTNVGLYRIETCERLGLWNKNLRIAEDWEYNLRLFTKNIGILYIPGVYVYVRKHNNAHLGASSKTHELLEAFKIMEEELLYNSTENVLEQGKKALAKRYLATSLDSAIAGNWIVARKALVKGRSLSTRKWFSIKLSVILYLFSRKMPLPIRTIILKTALYILRVKRYISLTFR